MTPGSFSLGSLPRHLSQSVDTMKDSSKVLANLRKLMKDRRYVREPLAAYIIPSCDAHDSEYIAPVDMRRQYVSNFTGSAGTAVVTQTQALLWTDGRYHNQAQKELDTNWILMKDGLPDTPSRADWLVGNLEPGSAVGIHPMLCTSSAWTELNDKLETAGCQLVDVETELVDLVWSSDKENPQPARPENPIFPLEHAFTGKTWQSKVEEVRAKLKERSCDVLILSSLDDVAWLLNLRGSDVEYNPVFFSYAAITLKEVVLFLNPSQVNSAVQNSLTPEDMEESVRILDYKSIKEYILEAVKSGTGKIWLADTASHGLVSLVPPKRRYLKVTPVTLMKAIKNDVELAGFEACHIRDGAAVCQYLAWLEKEISTGQITEISGADQLEQFRAELDNFIGLSFPSISSAGPHGAIIHYNPSPETDRTITREELYLIDSGAQYKDGTTDITRTVHFGTPSQHERECFTRVLKGVIGLAAAVFPAKIKGNCLDSFARKHLWDVGLDYLHGTGHGVGAFLNVHEGPMAISWRTYPNDPGLEAGMILSDEPGYYEDGKFGIRIENIVKIVPANTKHNFQGRKFLTFETVTVVPIQTKMIDPDLLTRSELEWLNTYHQTCRDRVGPLLQQMGRTEALEWLVRETQPIG